MTTTDIPGNSLTIEGFVEAVIDNTIFGWVISDFENPKIEIKYENVVIGSGIPDRERSDLPQKRPFAKGFAIVCEMSVSPIDFADENIEVLASNEQDSRVLSVWKPLLEAGMFSKLDLIAVKKAWNSVSAAKKLDALREFSDKSIGRGFGRISSDGSVQVGRNGHLFLTGGSNHLSRFYSDGLKLEIFTWVERFLSRHKILSEAGIQYLQLILPEKSSILHEYVPYAATPGSQYYLNLIESSLANNIPICNVLPVLLSEKEFHPLFPFGDTHFTTKGAEIVVNCILDQLGEKLRYLHLAPNRNLRAGDLSARFAGDGDVEEIELIYENISIDGTASAPMLELSSDPSSGHQGTRRIWRNESAPIKKTVVCFGNSFFERGGSSAGLSWWCARLFKEFHFIWNPSLDMDYVQSVKPDIVICQSIERFLTQIPSI